MARVVLARLGAASSGGPEGLSIEDLFSSTGPVGRCWCRYWRIGPAYRKRPPDDNKEDFHRVVTQGPRPPGLVALDHHVAVGWCQLTSRTDLPALERNPKLGPVDDMPVLAISCFYVRKGYHRRGVTSALIAAAVAGARRVGAPAIEAYPHTISLLRRDGDADVLRQPGRSGGLEEPSVHSHDHSPRHDGCDEPEEVHPGDRPVERRSDRLAVTTTLAPAPSSTSATRARGRNWCRLPAPPARGGGSSPAGHPRPTSSVIRPASP
jgi:GNAT superfamily N-acetyltransferase